MENWEYFQTLVFILRNLYAFSLFSFTGDNCLSLIILQNLSQKRPQKKNQNQLGNMYRQVSVLLLQLLLVGPHQGQQFQLIYEKRKQHLI